jgi:hypothetical protein
VRDQASFAKLWTATGLELPPEVDFGHKAVMAVGLGESSTCPYEFGSLVPNEDAGTLVLHLKRSYGTCRADFSFRTFVILVDAQELPTLPFSLVLAHEPRRNHEVLELNWDNDLE